MSDLIDRQVAIDLADDMWEATHDKNIHELWSKLIDLPPAQPEPRWIPVEIEPPKERRSYWVCTDTGYQCQCRWTNNRLGMSELDEWGWSIFDIPQYTKVVAYMPLPTAYERSEDE